MNAKRLCDILIIKVIGGGKSTPIDSSLCHSCHYSSEDSFRFRLSNSFRHRLSNSFRLRLSNSFRTLLPLLLLLTSCETIDLNAHSLVTFDGATYVVCHHLTCAPRKIYSLDSRDITLIIEDIETTRGPSPPL